VLVEELIEAVIIHADRLEVTLIGAPPLLVNLDEVGLRPAGTGTVVSEGGLELRNGECPWLSTVVRSCPLVLVSSGFRRVVVPSGDV
jgi:hypothetical protein